MQPESRIVAQIKKYLKGQGAFCFKVWGSEFMMAGLPDLICCYRGRFLAIEVKTPIGKVSARQHYVHNLIERAGGIVGVARSVEDAQTLVAAVEASIDVVTPVEEP